ERMRELISLRAFGLSEHEAVRYYVAMKMAEHGLLSAPNMACGEPFNIGITAVQAGLPGGPGVTDANGPSGGGGHAAHARARLDGRQRPRPAAPAARHGRLPRGGAAAAPPPAGPRAAPPPP